MAESILCYGIKSKFGLTQIEEISFDDLGKSGYDYQVAFKTIHNSGGNASFSLMLIKDGIEVNCLEIGGWKFEKFSAGFDWGGTWMHAVATDCTRETQMLQLASGKGVASQYKPTYVELLRQGFNELNRISTFGSITMLNLCEHNSISMYPSTLSSYCNTLKYMSEFCHKVEEIRNRLHNNPEDKDITAYTNVLKPKLIEYMEKLSNIKLRPETLDPNY